MKIQYEDGKAQAEADLKAINEKIQKQKNLQLSKQINMSQSSTGMSAKSNGTYAVTNQLAELVPSHR